MQKPVLKPVFIKLAGLLLLKTYDVCCWIFLAANFFQPNLVFIADSRTGFFFQTSLKTRVKTHKQPQELFCKNGVLRSFANFTGKETPTQTFSCGIYEIFNTYLQVCE